MQVLFSNDWLGTTPCFYNEITGAFSTSIHQVIDYRNLEIDADGLGDYLDFGYCVFGRTPVRHVRFLPPCTQLKRRDDGAFQEVELPDPVDDWSPKATNPDEVIQQLRELINQWEDSVSGPIVLPLSGGYDSRLLGALIKDKSRLRAFTYGVSAQQSESQEVSRAKTTASLLGCPWQQIPLGDYNQRLPDWETQFGISIHAHGMYHQEFYEKIAQQTGTGLGVLSGLVGDLWAGSIKPLPADSVRDLPALGFSRGIHANSQKCRLPNEGRYRRLFWEKRVKRLQNPICQIVEVIRQKMMLLRYLLVVPEITGFKPWTPFTNPQIALGMLAIPAEQRQDRLWQKHWFKRHGLAVEETTSGSRNNTIDLFALEFCPPEPLAPELLKELFPQTYLEEVNRRVFRPSSLSRQWAYLCGQPKIASLNRYTRIPNHYLAAYNTYETLKPLELLLRRRNNA